MSGKRVVVRADATPRWTTSREHLSSPVTVRVVQGYAVFDGKEQVTSGTVTIDDPATAEQLIAAGWVQRVEDKPRARKTSSTRTS